MFIGRSSFGASLAAETTEQALTSTLRKRDRCSAESLLAWRSHDIWMRTAVFWKASVRLPPLLSGVEAFVDPLRGNRSESATPAKMLVLPSSVVPLPRAANHSTPRLLALDR